MAGGPHPVHPRAPTEGREGEDSRGGGGARLQAVPGGRTAAGGTRREHRKRAVQDAGSSAACSPRRALRQTALRHPSPLDLIYGSSISYALGVDLLPSVLRAFVSSLSGRVPCSIPVAGTELLRAARSEAREWGGPRWGGSRRGRRAWAPSDSAWNPPGLGWCWRRGPPGAGRVLGRAAAGGGGASLPSRDSRAVNQTVTWPSWRD